MIRGTPVSFTTLLAATLLISSCAVGPNFKPPASPTVAAYTPLPLRSQGDTADTSFQHVNLGAQVQGDWWTLFRSAAIDSIVKEAIEHNRTLEASTATLKQARELARASVGARYPQVSLTAGAGRQKYGEEFFGNLAPPFTFTYFAIGPNVSYTLDLSGGIERGIEQQGALVNIAEHRLDAAYLTVTGQAVLQALAIASARAQIATLETLVTQDRDNLKLVQTAFQNGSVARTDVLAAESEIFNDMTLMPALKQDLATAQHALAIALGRVPAEALATELVLDEIALPTELPVSLPSELAHRRPDILAAEAQLHAATAAVGVAVSNLYPKIQLSATGAMEAMTPGQLFDGSSGAWGLIAGLTQPLFEGGKLRAERRAAVAAMQASSANYQEIVLEAFGQVADMLEALEHDAEQLDAQTQAQRSAATRLELQRESYTEGDSGVLQVLDAERFYQRSRMGYVRAVAQRYVDTVELFLALGGTSPNAREAVMAQ
jgi:NodT family efflux transporter outer membrane factor (OMF) lipoprotein